MKEPRRPKLPTNRSEPDGKDDDLEAPDDMPPELETYPWL
jgi:hypothetical protein